MKSSNEASCGCQVFKVCKGSDLDQDFSSSQLAQNLTLTKQSRVDSLSMASVGARVVVIGMCIFTATSSQFLLL